MKYVYLITCFTESGVRHDKNGYPIYGGQQTVGIYFSKKKALSALARNACDIQDDGKYAVLERTAGGLYSCPEVLGFFKYNPEKNGFEPTDEVIDPSWVSYVWSIV